MIAWSRFAEIVHGHGRFLLTTHVRPDGDALGSELAMAAILQRVDKQVRIVNAQPTPPRLRFIDPEGKIEALGAGVAAEELSDFDVLMVLDTCAWSQLDAMGRVIRTTRANKVVLDHHVSGDDLGAEVFKDPEAEATGRLVVEAADALGVPLDPQIATWLFVAVATDTGWFRFSSTRGDTYRLGARLIDAGAAPPDLYRDLYEQESLGRIKLLGRIIARAETELDGRVIHSYVTQEDYQVTGSHPADTEDAINWTLAVGGTQAALVFAQQPGGAFKVSFRSRCELDCSEVAAEFGGGGHRAAAGARVEGPLAAVRARILDAVRKAMP